MIPMNLVPAARQSGATLVSSSLSAVAGKGSGFALCHLQLIDNGPGGTSGGADAAVPARLKAGLEVARP